MSEEIKVGDYVKHCTQDEYVNKVVDIVDDKAYICLGSEVDIIPLKDCEKVYVYNEPKQGQNVSQVQEPCDDWRAGDITYRVEEIIPGKKTVTGARSFEPLKGYTHEECVMKAIEYGWHNLSKENRNLKAMLSQKKPKITQTEVEIKGGHMAGYGVEKPKVVQMTAPYENYPEHVLYDNGLIFQYYETTCEWQKRKMPHEQEDLKHLFE